MVDSIRSGVAGAALALALGAAVAPAAAQSGGPPVVGERITVVARAVAFDVVDARGRPVEALGIEDLRLLEDGVERRILEVRRLEQTAAPAPEGVEEAAPTEGPRPIPRGVLVAIDPTLLDRFAWKEALRSLRRAAGELAAIGPVEVVPLGSPGWPGVECGQDAERVRAELERIEAGLGPLDLFYRGREGFLREARRKTDFETGGLQMPGSRLREDALAWFESATRELANAEATMLEAAQDRLAVPVASKPRPLVVVWVAGGDPALAAFVRQFFDASPSELSESMRITAVAEGAAAATRERLQRRWREWAADGIQVVSWAAARPLEPDLASASFRRSSRARPERLAIQPDLLFEDAARSTGGARVGSASRLEDALESVRGRWVLVYQTDRDEPGWRNLEVGVRRRGWTVRAPRSLPVVAAGELRAPELPVELTVDGAMDGDSGTESVRITTRIGVAPLLDVFPAETPLRLGLALSLTLPSGRRVSRESVVRLESIPLSGDVVHTLDLVLPVGARELKVEVREETTGARGASDSIR